MPYSSRRIQLASTAIGALLVAAGLSLEPAQAQQPGAPSPSPVSGRLNPTGHTVSITVPAIESGGYLGDILLTIDTNDKITFSSQRAIDLLSNRVIGAVLDRLRSAFNARPAIGPGDFAGTGITATYDPQTLQLVFSVPVELRTSQRIAVSNINGPVIGTFIPPAKFSAYLNLRGSTQYVEKGVDTGLQSPVMFLDGAAHTGAVAVESEAIWHPGASNTAAFQRQGSRFIFDDTDNLIRWTGGDLQPVGQGYQSVPFLTGVSLFRSYSVLNPQMSARPSGDQSFQLTRPSDVTITVNGTNIQRLHLNAGSYNLRDFPFSQGANDITVTIRDDTGREQTLRFNVFYDQTQLAQGLTEFGFYAGVKSPLGRDGPDYTDQWEMTGFWRTGLSNTLTVGANFQIDQHSVMGGYQTLWASPVGTFGLDLAGSGIEDVGAGYAATLTFQRLFQFVGGQGDALNLSVTTRSKNFGPAGTVTPDNRYKYELTGGYTHAFNEDLYGSVTAHYSQGRDGASDVHDYHVIAGYRINQDLGLNVDASYQSGGFFQGFGAYLTLTWRTSPSSSARADYNTRENDARLSYQDISGSGVGSYNLSADVERSDSGSGVNAAANYVANHAEIGLSHFTSSDAGFSTINDERTSLNFGTSLGFADGAVAIGRPITQAFAIVEPHKTLHGADVYVDPGPNFYEARSDALGNALDGEISAYVPRNITVDVPDAPAGYDLGTGAYRINPPYRAGYKLVVGSDYNVTVLGRLLNADGSPVSLIAGRAVELANPTREPVSLFTNAQGRFGLSGLKPGQWRIEMPTEPETDYVITVPDNGKTAIEIGDLKPSVARN